VVHNDDNFPIQGLLVWLEHRILRRTPISESDIRPRGVEFDHDKFCTESTGSLE